MQRVEDLYRPYKQKRRTKAAIAREKGLAPFAEWLMNGPTSGSLSVEAKAKEFLNEEMELSTIEDVLAGAHEIIAEIVSDEPAYREHIREFTRKNSPGRQHGEGCRATKRASSRCTTIFPKV